MACGCESVENASMLWKAFGRFSVGRIQALFLHILRRYWKRVPILRVEEATRWKTMALRVPRCNIRRAGSVCGGMFHVEHIGGLQCGCSMQADVPRGTSVDR
jgi:hypothetical protein